MSARKRLLDSSVWIELLGSGPLAKACKKEFDGAGEIIVPTLVLFEVYRKIAASAGEDKALAAVALLAQHRIVDLTQAVALTAADISLEQRLSMADSIVLAHAENAGTLLVTMDNDFAGKPNVRVLRD